ncbi:MAG TPA: S8 family serine peptidase [Rhodospirillales bacterium]|nr:S8 family serine peptidase [Rhodospirillales bacterium]
MAGVVGAVFQQDMLYVFGGGDPAITIAVLDGPVDRTHDCFRGARLSPLDTVAQASRGADGQATAQGTHIASLIFGQPCSSVEGLAPLCRGLIVPIFPDDRWGCSQVELARAITLAVDHGAHVINISGGLFDRSRSPEPILIDAIARCHARNVLIVAAAGSDGCSHLLRDAGARGMLAVSAIDRNGELLAGAIGDDLQDHGLQTILVPGSNVLGAALEGGVACRSGANFAAALVSGIAGLLLSAQISNGRSADPRAVGKAILNSAAPQITTGTQAGQRALIGCDDILHAAWRIATLIDDDDDIAISPWDGSVDTSPWSWTPQAALRPRA